MKPNLIIILLISFFSTGIYAQLDDNLKAKLYFTESEKLFKQGDFKNSLVYVDKAEVTLGKPVARTLALRIKLAYNLGDFIMAKELFDSYTSKYLKEASNELNDEVLAMFINIEEAAEAEKPLFLNVNGRKLQVYKKDLGVMNWYDAKLSCEKLGARWRLPTIEELQQIYEQLYKNGKGGFFPKDYWSSLENGSNSAERFYFYTGTAGNYEKNGINHVLAVRDF